MKISTLLFMLLVLMSCSKDLFTPEEALKDFVESTIGKNVDRSFVLERTTAKMYQSFENMPDEDFAKFADMTNVKRDSFKILSKSCQAETCFITYSISFITKQDDKATFSSEVKKIAEMVSIEKKWLIADVSNIKTYHESLEAINALEK